jgi:hypothetical protein
MPRPPQELIANIAGVAGLVGLALVAASSVVRGDQHEEEPHGGHARPHASGPTGAAQGPSPALAASQHGEPPAPSPAPAAVAATGPAGEPAVAPSGDPYQEASTAPSLFAEAQRLTLAHPGYVELLAGVREQIDERFPGAAPSSIELQIAPLPDAQRAVLVHRRGQRQRPILFVFDSDRQVVWSRERPLAGLDAGIEEVALCPGPNGEVLLFWYDTPTRLVAARRLEKGGRLLADFKLVAIEAVEALTALYWPERGWLVATSGQGAVRAQLLTEQGKLPWGNDGQHLAQKGALRGPISVALDTAMSAVVVWPGASEPVGGRPPAPDYQAMRVDVAGVLLWRSPLGLGPAPPAGQAPRAVLERLSNGVVRVDLARAAPIAPSAAAAPTAPAAPSGSAPAVVPYSVEVTAEGKVLVR